MEIDFDCRVEQAVLFKIQSSKKFLQLPHRNFIELEKNFVYKSFLFLYITPYNQFKRHLLVN